MGAGGSFALWLSDYSGATLLPGLTWQLSGGRGWHGKHLPEDQGQEAGPGQTGERQALSPTQDLPVRVGQGLCHREAQSRSGEGWGPQGSGAMPPVPGQSL